MKGFANAFALLLLVVPALSANTKSEVVLAGQSHMEFDCPSNIPLHLVLRSGEILIVGTEDSKITIDLVGRNAGKIRDVKGRLSVTDHVAELHLTGGPNSELQIIVHVPRNSDLTARVFAGQVSVEKVIGNEDIELHAGELNIALEQPQEYGHVDMSVNAGEVDAEIFGGSKGGLFRSIAHDTGGRYRLRAHVGTGQLSVR
jgi:hypothetical protein